MRRTNTPKKLCHTTSTGHHSHLFHYGLCRWLTIQALMFFTLLHHHIFYYFLVRVFVFFYNCLILILYIFFFNANNVFSSLISIFFLFKCRYLFYSILLYSIVPPFPRPVTRQSRYIIARRLRDYEVPFLTATRLRCDRNHNQVQHFNHTANTAVQKKGTEQAPFC